MAIRFIPRARNLDTPSEFIRIYKVGMCLQSMQAQIKLMIGVKSYYLRKTSSRGEQVPQIVEGGLPTFLWL